MTMFIDPRGGSCDLIEPMRALGVKVKEKLMNSGDIAFTGRGEKGELLGIGIEHKKLADYLASMKGRLQGRQLTEMLKDYDRRYLIIEGEIEHDGQGRLTRRAGRHFWKTIPGAPPAVEVMKRMFVMELRGGISTYFTTKQRMTCLMLLALYRVWTDKDMDEHKSHLALYAPDLDPELMEDIGWFRDACGRLPGVGFKRSKSFESTFGGMESLMAADIPEIAAVKTNNRMLGTSTAQRIHAELHKG